MLLPELDRQSPLATQLYRNIKEGVLTGALPPDYRLPSSRELADDLKVSRNTVLCAYDQLLAEGYLESRVGAGTFVAAGIPDQGLRKRRAGKAMQLRPAKLQARLSALARRLPLGAIGGLRPPDPGLRIDFRYGVPRLEDFPAEDWRMLAARHLRHPQKAELAYAGSAGHLPLREAIARHVWEHRGITCSAEDVIIVNGSQQGLDLVARAVLDPGDRVLMENPTYPGARAIVEAMGAEIDHIGVDQGGLDVEKVRRLQHRVKLAYVTPSHQFPTGGVMRLSRRLSFLQWAHDSDAFVVEDDYDSEYRYTGRPIEAIHALDTYGQVIYLGTFSKILAPALRLGYIISPPPLTATLQQLKSLADRHSSTLAQQVLAEFLSTGLFERHLRRSRTRNASRRQALLKALQRAFGDSVVVEGANAGVHVLMWLKDWPVARIDEIVERAAQRGIGVYSIAPFYNGPPPQAGLLLGYSSLDEIEITAGINALAKALKS